MTDDKTLSTADLTRFTGSEHWYRHRLNRTVFYTDGVRYLAEQGSAYWLIDEIALTQRTNRTIAAEEFQVWTLNVHHDDSATMRCEDGDGRTLQERYLLYTDFPLPKIKLYVANNTIYLPSEH